MKKIFLVLLMSSCQVLIVGKSGDLIIDGKVFQEVQDYKQYLVSVTDKEGGNVIRIQGEAGFSTNESELYKGSLIFYVWATGEKYNFEKKWPQNGVLKNCYHAICEWEKKENFLQVILSSKVEYNPSQQSTDFPDDNKLSSGIKYWDIITFQDPDTQKNLYVKVPFIYQK